ncbi:MAG: hypothetical protein H6806_06385 [Planctomycetes bacterium]|nr:hypothetical protein [Planctomycetota bacterium]MCB9829368.1 hypothetical protein [Planctomycetota bacterium]
MLDDLKKTAAGGSARERFRLSIVVALCLLAGGGIYAATMLGSKTNERRESLGADSETRDTTPPRPFVVDKAALAQEASGDEPFRWSAAALRRIDDAVKGKVELPDDGGPVDVSTLLARPVETLRGEVVQVRGEVVALSQEGFHLDGRPVGPNDEPTRILQIAVLRGDEGGHVVMVRPILRDEVLPGRPFRYERDSGIPRFLQVGDRARARGVMVQTRTGTFDDVAVAGPAPVLYALRFRSDFPPDERPSAIEDPREADWEDVRDRTFVDTRRWDEPALFQTVRWARNVGAEEIAARIRDGRMPWTEWDKDTFEHWGKEVEFTEGDRPFTDGARGRLFRLDALIADVIHQSWAQIPANREGIDDLVVWDVMADDYFNVVIRTYVPFATNAFPPVEGKRKEHVRLFGVFVKNWTYELKLPDRERKRPRQVSVPTFLVLYAEPHPEGADSDLPVAMRWVAGGMVLLALLFYLVVVRAGRRAEHRQEEHRAKLRQRRRHGDEGGADADDEGGASG